MVANKFLQMLNGHFPSELMEMNLAEQYDYFDFEKNVKGWEDFSQSVYSKSSLNAVNSNRFDETRMDSYFEGRHFLSTNKDHLEDYIENFRKQLEEADCLDTLNLVCDFNSFWGGVR